MQTQALGFVLEKSPRRNFDLIHNEEHVLHASHPDALCLLETWERLSRRGGMVLGKHFPSRIFAPLLPNVVLFEKRAERCEFHVRLAGFAMLCFHGLDITGRKLSDFLTGDEHSLHRNSLRAVLQSGEPRVTRAEAICAGVAVLKREIVSLPVLASDLATALVMDVTFWNDKHWLN